MKKFVTTVLKHRQMLLGLLSLTVISYAVGFVCAGDSVPPISTTCGTFMSGTVTSTSTTVAKTNAETNSETVAETKLNYTEDELFCMAAAIYNEAGSENCSDDTRRMVGYVILNRVNDIRYPNTIRGVLEEKGQYGRFYYTGIEFLDRGDSYWESHYQDRAYRIAAEVLESRDNIPIPSNVLFQAEFKQGVSVYKYQDGLYFCCAKEVK